MVYRLDFVVESLKGIQNNWTEKEQKFGEYFFFVFVDPFSFDGYDE